MKPAYLDTFFPARSIDISFGRSLKTVTLIWPHVKKPFI
jgi:hypothetical protein